MHQNKHSKHWLTSRYSKQLIAFSWQNQVCFGLDSDIDILIDRHSRQPAVAVGAFSVRSFKIYLSFIYLQFFQWSVIVNFRLGFIFSILSFNWSYYFSLIDLNGHVYILLSAVSECIFQGTPSPTGFDRQLTPIDAPYISCAALHCKLQVTIDSRGPGTDVAYRNG